MTKFLQALLAAALALLSSVAVADDRGAFERAIKQDNDSAVRSMLSRGFDPNTRNEKGAPGLYMALQEGSLKVARVLIDSPRLKPEDRNASDESPLMMAALKGELDLAKRLIAKGADVNKPGWTPLHYAATSGHLDMIRLLLEEHAFIDAQSPNGTTPLMMAAQYGTSESVELLLARGADVNLRSDLDHSAADFARRVGRDRTADGLTRRMRKPPAP